MSHLQARSEAEKKLTVMSVSGVEFKGWDTSSFTSLRSLTHSGHLSFRPKRPLTWFFFLSVSTSVHRKRADYSV